MASVTFSIFLCVAVLSGINIATAKVCLNPCNEGWTYHHFRCHQYVPKEANWVDAEKHCLELGGNLASEESDEDHAFLKQLSGGDKPFWIGLSDAHKEGVWLWVNGRPVDYTKWNPGEPNNAGGEHCVHTGFGEKKDWNDISCDKSYPYICSMRIHF